MCFLIALLVLGGLAGVGYTVWRNKGGPGGPTRFATPTSSAAEATLADRYARGDLSEEEYWEKLSVLREAQSR